MSRWPKALLGDVLTPRNEVVHPRDHPVGLGIFVGLEHIEPGTGRRIGSIEIDLADLTGRKARFRSGDIVYGYLRPYLNKVWVADFDGYCSVDQYVFSVSPSVTPEYVSLYLRSPEYLRIAPITSTPGQLPRIRTDEVLEVPIPLPAIEDQRRIAAQLADQLAAGEQARNKTTQRRADAAALRAALLETGFAIPNAPRVAIGDLGTLEDGDWILNADYALAGVRLLQVGDVGRGVLTIKSKRFISPERAGELNCTLLRPGDILISRMPDPIGRACAIPDLGYEAITAVDVAIFRPREEALDREFAVLYMNSRRWLQAVAARASGATRARISRRNLERQLIPLPRLSDQRRIASELRERLTTIDAITKSIEKELDAIEALPATLLSRAFAEPEAA
jgi:type I restriction enzyme S subunit